MKSLNLQEIFMTGAELKKKRESQNPPRSVEWLADRLGGSANTVYKWETGKRKIRRPMEILINQVLK